MVTIVDDYEDGDLSEYTAYSSDGSWSVVESSSEAYEGSYSAQDVSSNDADNERETIYSYSHSGLNAYPSAGDEFEVWVWQQSTALNLAYRFGVQDGSENADFYEIDVYDGSLNVAVGGSQTTIADLSSSISDQVWERFVVSWGSDGSFTIEHYDGSGNLKDSASGSDTNFSSGGVGMYREVVDTGTITSGAEARFDYVTIASQATFSGTVVDANSNAIEGATVYAINAQDGSITGSATTASDGTYSIGAPDTSTAHHLIVQYTDSDGNDYYALSKPYVTAVSG